jgi:hypothetical protein
MRWLGPRAFRDLPTAQRTWLVPGLLPEGVRVLLVAPPKTGKSFLALQLAYEFAAGRPCLGFTPARPLRVIYLDIDAPATEMRDRLEQWMPEHPPGPALAFPHPDDVTRPLDVTTPAGRAWVAEARELAPDLVVLDVLRELHSVNEDQAHEIKRVTDALDGALPRPIATLLVHHTRKIGDEAAMVDPVKYARGSGGLTGWADAVWLVHRGVWHLRSRFQPDAKVRLTRGDGGFWTLAENSWPALVERALALCAAYPTLTHEAMLPHVKAEAGWSRATWHRYLKGQRCVHRTKEAS